MTSSHDHELGLRIQSLDRQLRILSLVLLVIVGGLAVALFGRA